MLEHLALIGNCQCSALVDSAGAIVWSCLPRFDSEPVFARLLDPAGGAFSVGPPDGRRGVQSYIENTNVVMTRFDGPDGAFRVIDFCPRFLLFERSFRPAKIVRIIEPISGAPRVRVSCEPVLGWSKRPAPGQPGSNHVSFAGYRQELRLTTDVPLAYLEAGRDFALTERRHMVLAWGEPIEEPLPALCERFLHETARYWQRWVKHCNIPARWQEQVIRSALALKLHCYEDTGAIVAALTTSIPESPGSGRTWDYRYCWLRDTSYALGAFHLLGHFEEREQFLHYLLDVAGSARDLELAPLYRIDGGSDLSERTLPDWAGYEGEGPVRVGNQAAEHRQHDVFGEMVLALTPLFLDARFRHQLGGASLDLVTALARKAAAVAGQPDAGIWELRAGWHPQTFSSVMCWAACDRMTRIAERWRPELAAEMGAAAARIHQEILDKAIDPARGSLVAAYGGREVDASLLQAVTLRFLPPDDPRMHATIDAVRQDLEVDGWLRRYRVRDDFGVPSVAFVICTFWLVEALAVVGRMDEARALMTAIEAIPSPLGLLAEDYDPTTRRMWGNYPQAYSHIGLIHAAFAASPPWAVLA
ncbi:MAG: glycoside hydrolase family 15 protein [Myxococcota bacterium]